MSKKRVLAIILSSPVLLAMVVAMLIAASILYALEGKWMFKQMFQENITFKRDSK